MVEDPEQRIKRDRRKDKQISVFEKSVFDTASKARITSSGMKSIFEFFLFIKKRTLCQRIEWYVARTNQIAALGYVFRTNQIVALGFVSRTNQIAALRHVSRTNHIIAFEYPATGGVRTLIALHHGCKTKSESFVSCRGRVNISVSSKIARINVECNEDSLSVAVPSKV